MIQNLAEIQLHWFRVRSDPLEVGPCIVARCVVNRWDEGGLRKDSWFPEGIKAPQLQRFYLNARLDSALDTANK